MTTKPKLVILGMGFLMSHLKPCYHHLYGEELSPYIAASTHSAQKAPQRAKEMGFPVVCQGELELLQAQRPEIILFSPIPTAAPDLVERVVAPYYAGLRQMGQPLPDFYAFPPTPTPDYYQDKLGKDVHIVNILPNMANTLAGRDISQEGYSLLTFPDGAPWPQENLERLREFLRPVGGTIDVPLRHTTTVLGCYVCSHVIQETAHTAAAALTHAGLPLSHSQMASAMRARLLQVSGRRFPDSLECFSQAAGSAQPLAEAVLDRFVAGMQAFNREAGIPEELGNPILYSQTDIFLQSAQLLDWEEIQVNNSHHATKGGILEMALHTFQEVMEQGLFQLAAACRDGRPTPQLEEFVEAGAREISRRVAAHGARLAG